MNQIKKWVVSCRVIRVIGLTLSIGCEDDGINGGYGQKGTTDTLIQTSIALTLHSPALLYHTQHIQHRNQKVSKRGLVYKKRENFIFIHT